jgi:hypothetical protein
MPTLLAGCFLFVVSLWQQLVFRQDGINKLIVKYWCGLQSQRIIYTMKKIRCWPIWLQPWNLFFLDSRKPHSRKVHFMGPGERVKPRLSQTLTRGARPDSNSRPAVQILNSLSSRYASWGLKPWNPFSVITKTSRRLQKCRWRRRRSLDGIKFAYLFSY